MSEKTEEPTPRRLREARAEGESGASAYLSSAVAFVVAVGLLPAAMRALVAASTEHLRGAIAQAREVDPVAAATAFGPTTLASDVVMLSLPLVAGVAAVTALAHLVQTQAALAPKRVAPRLSRLDPIAGAARLFSAVRLFAVLRGVLGAAAAVYLADAMLREHLVDLARLPGRLAYAAAVAAAIARRLAWGAAVAFLVLAAFDALVAWRAFRRRLRMTKAEVKRHHKESEGDPEMKRARRRASEEMLASVAVAGAATATLLVAGPAPLACALRYDAAHGDDAPVVVSTARGEVAEKMIRAARERGVPVVVDARLAGALLELSPGEAIPESLYDAVALLLRDVAA